MDYDNGDETIWNDIPKIAALGAPFRIYTSGGKGYHVEILTELMKGTHVPYSHKVFVRNMGLAVDMGLYRHERLFSNPGRVHPKTGNKKRVLMEFFDGVPLKIPESIPVKATPVLEQEDSLMFRQAVMRLNRALTDEPEIGNRHNTIWGVAKDFRLAGFDLDITMELMHSLNDSWEKQKETEEVEAAVNQAYLINGAGVV